MGTTKVSNITRKLKSRRGAAYLEFALISPILLTLFLGVADLGRAINSYMQLAHIAGEGLRAATQDPSLEVTPTGPMDLMTLSSTDFSVVQHYPGQYSLQTKVSGLADLYQRTGRLGVSQLHISSGRVNPLATTNSAGTVSVSITGMFNGAILKNFRLTAQKSGRYLFN